MRSPRAWWRWRRDSRKLVALASLEEGALLMRQVYLEQILGALIQLYTWNPDALQRHGATFELIYDLADVPRTCGRRLARSLLVRVGAREVGLDVWTWPPQPERPHWPGNEDDRSHRFGPVESYLGES